MSRHPARRSEIALWVSYLVLAPLVVAISGGCARTVVLVQPTGPNATTALVYFIRRQYPPYIRGCKIVVNNKVLAAVANNEYVAVDLPAGRNHVVIDNNDSPLAFDMEADPDEIHYVVFTGDVTWVAYAHPVYTFRWSRRVFGVDREQGQRLLKELGPDGTPAPTEATNSSSGLSPNPDNTPVRPRPEPTPSSTGVRFFDQRR
jgi:hypothetical protein